MNATRRFETSPGVIQPPTSKAVARIGGQTSGYVLLAASFVFLVNVGMQALEAGVFDAVVAAMIGVVAVTAIVGVALIAAFSLPRGDGAELAEVPARTR